MITKHQFIKEYPINPESTKLLLGTIHPHNHLNFMIQFFYGNENSIWNILGKAFPGEITNPVSLESVISFLNKNSISVSDTILECKRLSQSALDGDLEPIELNHGLIKEIRDSKINEILFTSGFARNNAFRLFYVDILGLKLTQEIKNKRQFVLNDKSIGRPIKLTILYSPAGTANVGISKSKAYLEKAHLYKNSRTPVADFKVDYYRQLFK